MVRVQQEPWKSNSCLCPSAHSCPVILRPENQSFPFFTPPNHAQFWGRLHCTSYDYWDFLSPSQVLPRAEWCASSKESIAEMLPYPQSLYPTDNAPTPCMKTHKPSQCFFPCHKHCSSFWHVKGHGPIFGHFWVIARRRLRALMYSIN